jgi:hypothetical protein
VEGNRKKKFTKNGTEPDGLGIDPRPATSGRPPAAGQHLARRALSHFLEIFKINFFFPFLGSVENGLGPLGDWVHSTPIL